MNRWTNALAGMLLAAMLAVVALPGHAETQEERRPELSAETLIETARKALAKGNLEDAEFLLEGVRPGEGNVDDLDFLFGTIAAKRGDWETAIARFRAILARDPELPRVRLDLALAYFQARQDGSAAYHFRQALGDESLAPVARARALAYLDAIRRRRSWSLCALRWRSSCVSCGADCSLWRSRSAASDICLSSLAISLPISVSAQRMCSRPSGMPLRWEA